MNLVIFIIKNKNAYYKIDRIRQVLLNLQKNQQKVALNLQPTKMNNNSSLNYHCFSCGKQLQINNNNSSVKKHQYPVCNQTTDAIYLQKHILCETCHLVFQNIKFFVTKYKLQWFNKEFKLQKIIDPTFIKMSHIQTTLSFIKQNRKSQIQQISEINKLRKNNEDQGHLVNGESLKANINLPNDIYSSIINDNIQQNHLHNVFWLPKTVQYLIYLTSIQRIKSQQRKQRVKKLLQFLSFTYFVDQTDLKYLAIIVQNLLCFMDEDQFVKIMDPLLKSFIRNNISLNFFIDQDKLDDSILQKSFEGRIHKNKQMEYRSDNILQNIFSILILSDFYKDSKLKKHVQELKKLSFKEQQHSKSINQKNSRQKVFQDYLKKNIPQKMSPLSTLSQKNWEEIVEIKKQKNHLNLIAKMIKKQQEENNNIVKQLQNRHKKQKDEYINKIIKLNNRIEELEYELKNSKLTITQLTNQNLNKTKQIIKLKQKDDKINDLTVDQTNLSSIQKQKINKKSKQNADQCKSNPQLNSKQKSQNNQDPSTQINEPSQKIQQFINKKHKSQIQNIHLQQQFSQYKGKNLQQGYLDYMKSILIVTDIISFNHKVNKKSSSFPISQIPNSIKQLSQLIILQINQLQKKVSSLIQQNKKLKDQSTRVLSILKRKQQQWLPLFHQKDQIISLYEKALICLENGVILADQPLSTRIKIILNKITKIEFLKMENQQEQISMRDSVLQVQQVVMDNDLSYSQSGSPTKQQDIRKAETKQKNSTNKPKKQVSNGEKTIKKKVKKQKQKQSDCQVF